MDPMRGKILLVDDEPDILEWLSYSLRKHGYVVHTACNGLKALNQARRFLPDVILLDLMMEGMDGFTVCGILRRQPSTARVPVILLTALAGEMARFNGMAAGADEFLRKPLHLSELLRSVDSAIRRSTVRKEALAGEAGAAG
jgi:DNA-binding response OmpR family regulator